MRRAWLLLDRFALWLLAITSRRLYGRDGAQEIGLALEEATRSAKRDSMGAVIPVREWGKRR